jgi:endonuclease/exonuclease/phosphatase family metal-dependent hydrolase
MRPLIHRIVQDLSLPDASLLEEARRTMEPSAHARYLERIAAFHELEARAPAQPLPWPGKLRVAALNAKRLKHPLAVRELLDYVGAPVSLLSEVDLGMARTGNVHTLRKLIGASGQGYLYGVEFVELDLGSHEEMREHAGERNTAGFHGNALVSRLGFETPYLIPLEESGFWFPGFEEAQRRIGGRMALACRISDAPRPLWIVSLHLESKTDPADRQNQIRNLLRALDHLAPNEACVIGGDFNTKALPRGEGERHRVLESPEREEPLFADLRNAGFAWADANLDRPTQRMGPWDKPKPPLGKLDWLMVRGLRAENPQVIPVLDTTGQPISDHDMLTVDLAFEGS